MKALYLEHLMLDIIGRSGFLTLVDEKQLGLGQGRDISFLNKEAQETVYECIQMLFQASK